MTEAQIIKQLLDALHAVRCTHDYHTDDGKDAVDAANKAVVAAEQYLARPPLDDETVRKLGTDCRLSRMFGASAPEMRLFARAVERRVRGEA